MTLMPSNRKAALALIVALTAGASTPTARGAIQDAGRKEKVHRAIDRGLKWLRAQQQKNGSWENHPGITALSLTAFTRSHRAYREDDGPFMRNAVHSLEAMVKPDGGIYDKDLPVYNTSVAVMALCSTGNSAHAALIRKASAFLAAQQSDEGTGYEPADKFYGGIGYGNDERPDLSNLQFAIESLRAASLDKNDAVWDRAIKFLERCQNRSESNDQSWAANDGGFVYQPGSSMAGGTKSYGSMTYAGIKSMIHAHLKRDDPRVRAAVDWVRRNYTLKENPEMGAQGLYYYYHTMAKALRVYGDPEIVDDKGQRHRWAEELADELLARQHDEGFWVNSESGRWWEDNKVLVTSEAIMALEEALGDLGPPKDPCPALSATASAGVQGKGH